MNTNYLDDIPVSEEWLAQRKLEWLGDGSKQGLKHRLFKHGDSPKLEIAAYEKYFFEGDIHAFAMGSERISVEDIIYFSPVQSLSAIQCVISQAINWLLNNRNKVGSNNKRDLTIDEYLAIVFRYTISPPLGNYLPDNVTLDMFFWLFGKKYEKRREVVLIGGDTPYILNLTVDVEHMCSRLQAGIRDYIWNQCDKRDSTRYKFLIDYFLSLYPYLNVVCFSKTIPPASSFEVGASINKGSYSAQRWLIASLNHIVTEFDIDNDYEELEAIIINDQKAFDQLRTGIEEIVMPNEFYELEKFVLKYREGCISVSE
jgi:hypothetical protein